MIDVYFTGTQILGLAYLFSLQYSVSQHGRSCLRRWVVQAAFAAIVLVALIIATVLLRNVSRSVLHAPILYWEIMCLGIVAVLRAQRLRKLDAIALKRRSKSEQRKREERVR